MVVVTTASRLAYRHLMRAPHRIFAATIRNANTRMGYMNAVADFLAFAPVAALGSPITARDRCD
jgi:hypothetical protein